MPSSQAGAAAGAHSPAWHVSAPLQKVLSAQDVPLGFAGCVHAPRLHTSFVHVLPSSLQAAELLVNVHPLVGSHESFVHGLSSLHTSAVPAVQVPAWQVSVPLHALPSLHTVPLVAGAYWHMPPLHVSVVQALPSLHWLLFLHAVHPLRAVCWQVPSLQVSVVQASPSSQLDAVQPAAGGVTVRVNAPLRPLYPSTTM
jgi:hypothetical protein